MDEFHPFQTLHFAPKRICTTSAPFWSKPHQIWSAEQVSTSGLAVVSKALKIWCTWKHVVSVPQTPLCVHFQYWHSSSEATDLQEISSTFQLRINQLSSDTKTIVSTATEMTLFYCACVRTGGDGFSRTSSIYGGWLKRRERERVERRVINEKQF